MSFDLTQLQLRLYYLPYPINFHRLGLFKITNAAMTPGTQPQSVKIKTIKTEPHPRSKTAKGGKTMDNKTRKKLIF